jgi:hypothetical protein
LASAAAFAAAVRWHLWQQVLLPALEKGLLLLLLLVPAVSLG